jgi:hypothetical protein
MPDAPENSRPDAERLRDQQGVRGEAWKQTVEEMELLAEERRDNDWDVVTIPALHVSVLTQDIGDPDEFGFEYVIPDNYTEEFSDAFDPDAVSRYQVYRTIANQNVFQVLELLAPETGTAILVAGMYELRHAGKIQTPVQEEERVHTIVRTIDDTRLGMLEHEDYDPLLPDQVER